MEKLSICLSRVTIINIAIPLSLSIHIVSFILRLFWLVPENNSIPFVSQRSDVVVLATTIKK
jgi:hypothetical protein